MQYTARSKNMNRVHELRKKRRLTVARLALAADISYAWAQFIDQGKVPSPDVQRRVAEALGVTVEEAFPPREGAAP